MKNALRFTALIFFISFSNAAFCDDAASACATPDLRNLIHDYAKQAAAKKKYFPDADAISEQSTHIILNTENPLVEWTSVSWEGPVGGILFAIGCDGREIDSADVGGVENIKQGPMLPGVGETVLVRATDGTGTCAIHKTISILAIKNDRLALIWKHTLFEYSYFPGEDGEETEFKVSVPNKNIIEVTGEHRTYRRIPDPDNGDDWSKTPTKIDKSKETYCWNQSKFTYISCTSNTQ